MGMTIIMITGGTIMESACISEGKLASEDMVLLGICKEGLES